MKPNHLRVQPPTQINLFDSPALLPQLTALEIRHEELVDLLSQLLWQVVQDVEAAPHLEDSNEQD